MNNKKLFSLLLLGVFITTSNGSISKFFSTKYVTYKKEPNVIISGIEDYGHYGGIIDCFLKVDNPVEVGKVFVTLDDLPLQVRCKKIGSKKFDIPFKIDSTKLSKGQHSLRFKAVDSSYHKNTTLKEYNFYVDNTPFKAEFLKTKTTVLQGQTIHLKIKANKKAEKIAARFLTKTYPCYLDDQESNTYECFIPVECEQETGSYPVYVQVKDLVGSVVRFSEDVMILNNEFPKAKGYTVSQSKLKKEAKYYQDPKEKDEMLQKALKESPNKKLWSGAFGYPIKIRKITTPFGEIRKKKDGGTRIHKAVDLTDYPKCPVRASQDGRVVLKDFYKGSGKMVVVDHGLSVFTYYLHLDDFADVEVGDVVKKGVVLGWEGMTGNADGYHLHWALRVNDIAVDPFQWTQKEFWG